MITLILIQVLVATLILIGEYILRIRPALKWLEEYNKNQIKNGRTIQTGIFRRDYITSLTGGIIISWIPIFGLLGATAHIITFMLDNSLYDIYRINEYIHHLKYKKELKNQKEREKKNAKAQATKDRLIIRKLRQYPELYSEILSNPDHTYYEHVRRLQGEGKASICIKDGTLTLDGKTYRLEKVDIT